MSTCYRFRIEGSFTPETLPMERLAAYVAELAKMLGEQDSVHLRGVEPGSAVLVAVIDEPAQPKVRDRITAVQNGHGPSDARQAFAKLDNMLRKDNASGTLSDEAKALVIPFPGRERPEPIVYGPFRQDATIDGQLLRIGGKDETIPVHLRDGAVIHIGLHCSPDLARRMAPHLLGPTLRVHGTGTWLRDEAGAWELQRFRITDYEVLDDAPLLTVVDRLRAVPGNAWDEVPDPVRTLLEERHGDEGGSH
jgi:hypothetical protein